MAQTGSITQQFSLAGVGFGGVLSETGEGGLSQVVPLPAGIAGSLADATNIDSLVTGHGLVDTDTLDIHWTDATTGLHKVRRGINIVSVDTNAIVIDETPAGTGDALPVSYPHDVVIAVQVPIVMAPIGDDILMLAMKSTQRATVDFEDGGVSDFAHNFGAANDVYSWDNSTGFTNPLAGTTPDQALATNGSIVAATLTIGILLDSVA